MRMVFKKEISFSSESCKLGYIDCELWKEHLMVYEKDSRNTVSNFHDVFLVYFLRYMPGIASFLTHRLDLADM